MRPCDEPRDFPDWVPQAAPCDSCGKREWGHYCEELPMPLCDLGEN